jgi:hypothetical protein
MRIDLKNIASVLIDKYIIILFLIFALTVLSGLGLSNFMNLVKNYFLIIPLTGLQT